MDMAFLQDYTVRNIQKTKIITLLRITHRWVAGSVTNPCAICVEEKAPKVLHLHQELTASDRECPHLHHSRLIGLLLASG
jgi:hypothetical protein